MIETLSGTILSVKFHQTLSSWQHQVLLCLILYFAERKEENVENAETAEIAEDAAEGPAPAPTAEGPVPAPAPAATLEIVHERPHSKNKEKSTENFGRPASTYSDFYIQTLFQPGLADTQYNIDFLRNL